MLHVLFKHNLGSFLVVQGILMINPGKCLNKEVMIRLWVHESLRVFHDRLINDEDKSYFKNMLLTLIKTNLNPKVNGDELFGERTIIFGDFLRIGLPREEREYEEVLNLFYRFAAYLCSAINGS